MVEKVHQKTKIEQLYGGTPLKRPAIRGKKGLPYIRPGYCPRYIKGFIIENIYPMQGGELKLKLYQVMADGNRFK